MEKEHFEIIQIAPLRQTAVVGTNHVIELVEIGREEKCHWKVRINNPENKPFWETTFYNLEHAKENFADRLHTRRLIEEVAYHTRRKIEVILPAEQPKALWKLNHINPIDDILTPKL